MAMRAVAMRLGAKRGGLLPRSLQSRACSDGRVLSEEERVAENRYIKKMEQEKLEKAKQGIKVEEPAGSSSSSSSSSSDSSSIPGPSTNSSKNIAVFAGIAGILAVGVWYARSGTKKEEEKKA